jgi:chromosomal replication initiation ATPase DnaA
MNQLSLNIPPRLSYAAENYLPHAGVRDILAAAEGITAETFQLLYCQGSKRKGKTHLSVKLCDLFSRRGFYPRIVEGERIPAWLTELRDGSTIIIIDDVDHYLRNVLPGDSGPFVSRIEELRTAKIPVIALSSVGIEELPCDNHVKSRLFPGAGLHLGSPDIEELPRLVTHMARQRGMLLSERKVGYVVRRIGRDIEAIENYLDRLDYLSNVLGGQGLKFQVISDAV